MGQQFGYLSSHEDETFPLNYDNNARFSNLSGFQITLLYPQTVMKEVAIIMVEQTIKDWGCRRNKKKEGSEEGIFGKLFKKSLRC